IIFRARRRAPCLAGSKTTAVPRGGPTSLHRQDSPPKLLGRRSPVCSRLFAMVVVPGVLAGVLAGLVGLLAQRVVHPRSKWSRLGRTFVPHVFLAVPRTVIALRGPVRTGDGGTAAELIRALRYRE